MRARPRSARGAALVGALLVGLAPTSVTPSAAVAAAPGPAVQVLAPAAVPVGDTFDVRIIGTDLPPTAGFEAALSFDPGAVELVGATSVARDGFRDLSLGDTDGRALTGAYACAAACAATAPLPAGALSLATITLRATQPGRLTLHLDDLLVVDATGSAVDADVPVELTVQAGDDTTDRVPVRATAPVRPTLHPVAVTPATLTDLSADGRVDAQDLTEVALAWQTSRLAGDPCAGVEPGRDADGDGCVDVGDLVALAAQPQPTGTATPTASIAPATWTVTATTDESDSNIGNGVCRTAAGACTLRAAMQEAGASTGADTIVFAIPGAGVHTIQLTKQLPTVADLSGGVTIDGTTQPGSAPNTDPIADNAVINVAIRGTGGATFDAFAVTSGGNVFRGLSVYDVRRAFWIYGASAVGNRIVGDFVGTDPTGTFAAPTIYDVAHGINPEQDAARTVVGTPALADRNVISGNSRHGIGFWHGGTDDNLVQNNIIGLSPDGSRALPNQKHGVDLNFGVSGTLVGGTGPHERNVISGNVDTGVEVSHTADTTGNRVVGNLIGTTLDGTGAAPYTANGDTGIYSEDAAAANVYEANVIGNNQRGGVNVLNGGVNGTSFDNVVRGNWIGVTPAGTPIPNGVFGVSVDASRTRVEGNTIAFNSGPGIRSQELDAQQNTFTRNSIHDNAGLGIDLAPLGAANPNDPGDADSGPNGALNAPVFTHVGSTLIAGTACASCVVELFTTPGALGTSGPGATYVATATADATGAFAFPAHGLALSTKVTATTTDPTGATSEFGLDERVSDGNHAPFVNAGPDTAVEEASTVTLAAAGQDSDGDPLSYAWDLDADGSFETPGQTAVFDAHGVPAGTKRTVKVQVRDTAGATAVDALVVTVYTSLPLPTARFDVPATVLARHVFTIGFSEVSVPSGATFAFDCGSGWGSPTPTPTRTCLAGTAPAEVRGSVTDAEGLTREYRATVLTVADLLANGGFEADADGDAKPDGWTTGAKAALGSPAHDGALALTQTTPGSVTTTTWQTVPATRTRVTATAWAYITGAGSAQLKLSWLNRSGGMISTSQSPKVSGSTAQWTPTTKTLVPPNGAVAVKVQVVVTTAAGATVAVDDVSLVYGNQLLDPDLDLDANGDGRPDSWFSLSRFTRASAPIYSSSWAGVVTGDGSRVTPGQRSGYVVPGATYRLTVWIRMTVPADSYTLRVYLRFKDAANVVTGVQQVALVAGSTAGWQQVSGTMVAPPGSSGVNVELTLAGLDTTFAIDQATLVPYLP